MAMEQPGQQPKTDPYIESLREIGKEAEKPSTEQRDDRHDADSYINYLRRIGAEEMTPGRQRERQTAWQLKDAVPYVVGGAALGGFGLAKVGDLVKWLLKQSKETADIAKGWDEGQAFIGMPRAPQHS